LQGRTSGDYPFIKVRDFNSAQNLIRINGADHWVDEVDTVHIQGNPFGPGTSVFAKIGEALKQNRVRLLTEATFIDNNLMGATPKVDVVDPHYLFQLLRTFDFAATNAGTAVPYITAGSLGRSEVLVPTLAVQQRIASILGAYDDLIEVNRRRIEVLEEMARRLFEEWFVNFRFPKHDVEAVAVGVNGALPGGWRRVGLHDVAEVAFGFPFKSPRFNTEGRGCRVVRIRDVPAGETATFTDEPFDPRYAVRDGDLLVGMDGIFHTAIWSGGDAALNQRICSTRGGRRLAS
jgi:type I restriction enzyme S subunit